MVTVMTSTAETVSTGTPTKPIPGKTQENISKGKGKTKEIENTMFVVETNLIKLQSEILSLETEKLNLK